MKNLFKSYCLIIVLALPGIAHSSNSPLLEYGKNPSHPVDVLFMGDSQIHNLFMGPNFFRSRLADKISPVAIRPPQQDFHAPDLLQWTLRNFAENKHVVFLGDALDVACKNEWETFTKAMNPNKPGKIHHKGWVMAPGNHDFFFYGITNGSRGKKDSAIHKSWAKACSSKFAPKATSNIKETILAKDDFVRAYTKVLLAQNKANPEDFPITKNDIRCKRPRLSKKNYLREPRTHMIDCEWEAPNKDSFYQRLYYSLPVIDDIRVSYKSLIIQEINLTPKGFDKYEIKGILMDFTNYRQNPTILGILNGNGKSKRYAPLPGVTGGIQRAQIKKIKRWIREDNDPNTLYIFMGHHNLKSLSFPAQKLMKELVSNVKKSLFMSGHTHSGFINQKEFISEINVGSMTDWHPQFVQLGTNQTKGEPKVIVSRNLLGKIILEKKNLCLPEHNLTGKKWGYTSYKSLKKIGQNAIFDYTLSTIGRSFYQVFDNLNLWGDVAQTSHKKRSAIQENLTRHFEAPEVCRRFGKRARACQKAKFDLIQSAIKVDETLLMDQEYYENRLTYGSCQTLWASNAENSLRKK